MFPSPLKFIRLLSPSKQMKPNSKEITPNPPNPNSTTTFYLSITSKGKILYQQYQNGREIESLASLCLEQTPLYHKWYFHTVGTKSFGFLTEQNLTIFAIVDPTLGSIALQDFLNRVRQVFISVTKKSLQKELVPVINNFLNSVEKNTKNEGNIVNSEIPKGRNGKKRGTVQIEEEIETNGEEREESLGERNEERHGERGERHGERGERSEMIGLERKSKRAVWLRHVKIVAIVDFVVCLVLFAVWLGVCQGFECVKS